MRSPIQKIEGCLEDLHEIAVTLANERAMAFKLGKETGIKECPVCLHRESGGTDEQTLKIIIEKIESKFPKNKNILEFLKKLQ